MTLIPRILLLLLTLFTTQALGQAFITTWKTDNPGISANNQITIPTTGTGYSYSIAWEKIGNAAIKGTIPGPITGNHTITFPSTGTYRVSITGAFPRIYFNSYTFPITSDSDKIISVEQWGSNAWKSMERAFMGCRNLTIPAVDAPNLTQVLDMGYMFYMATSFNEPINHWDVSHVLYMYGMFHSAVRFNQPIAAWDVSSVTYMGHMFYGASSFNQPIETWDVSHVTSMVYMFGSLHNRRNQF
jgi:surface protein